MVGSSPVHNYPKKYHLLRFYALTGTKKSSGFYAFQKNINFVMIYYEIQQLMEMLFIAGLIIIHPLGCTLNKIPLSFRFIWTQIKIYFISLQVCDWQLTINTNKTWHINTIVKPLLFQWQLFLKDVGIIECIFFSEYIPECSSVYIL